MYHTKGINKNFNYEKGLKTFENKFEKRDLEIVNRNIIKDTGLRGSIMCLPGPYLTQHAEQYRSLLDKSSLLVLTEFNRKMIDHNNMVDQYRNLENRSNIRFHKSDIWSLMKKPYYGKRDDFILFDLDFCLSASGLVHRENLLFNLRELAGSNKPNKNGFFISLTVCKRGDAYEDWINLISNIPLAFMVKNWKMKSSKVITYKGRSENATMVNYLFHFKKDYNLKRTILQNKINFEEENIKDIDLKHDLKKEFISFNLSIQNTTSKQSKFYSTGNQHIYQEELLTMLRTISDHAKGCGQYKLFLNVSIPKDKDGYYLILQSVISKIFELKDWCLNDVSLNYKKINEKDYVNLEYKFSGNRGHIQSKLDKLNEDEI